MAEYEWQRVAREIEREITTGRIPPGGALPSIVRLAEAHGVADRTVRRALQDLRERGLIETLPHKGSFVPTAEEHGGV
ncbi:winged helix-turn-helix domain-containing protein [Streptomyces sp. NBC_01764]|uniref:winged helix-turn-helix domain-containing protein n=1 Tax=Streptomyces sp. NBC_01764 TaxID=2975935 RepID=UPI0022512CB3|nr:winged helix-turn-helix domain-containing protein [Streptomyces sp. NBC_01764]MCX4400639.1 winged helix-turn-helix domain-containing protein [Streptomyces sp. NBC_01764]